MQQTLSDIDRKIWDINVGKSPTNSSPIMNNEANIETGNIYELEYSST